MDEVEGRKSQPWMPVLRQCFVTLSVAVNIAGHGCVIGFSAILIPSLRKPESYIHPTPSEESWIASILGIALICGNFIVTPMMQTTGRKKCSLLTTIPILIGWFVLLFASSVTELIVARFCQGISMGMLGPLGSIIIGEMTDPKNRGAFLTAVSLSLTTGVMFIHTLGSYISWQYAALVSSFVTFTSLCMIVYTPESPSFLISQGKFEESKEVFAWLRGVGPEQDEELESMIIAQKLLRKSSVAGQKLPFSVKISRFFRYFGETSKKPEFYKPIVIMLHLYTMFQFAGINVISSYATDIIKNVVSPDVNAQLIMVILDMERLICNILAVFLMKYLNRRTLLFSSGTVCVLAYIGKGVYVYLKQSDMLPFENIWIPLFLIFTYMFCLSVGITSIPFAISGEIFPLEYRGLGGCISVLALSSNFFIAVKCFPVLTGAIGLPMTYWLYAAIVIYCLTVCWFMMPETKGKTLQEIEDEFRGLSLNDRRTIQPLNSKSVPDMGRRCSSQILY